MAEKKKSTKKVKDLDPKGRSADVKGGRGNLLSRKQRELVQNVVKKGRNAIGR
jgi:hypothetical protein